MLSGQRKQKKYIFSPLLHYEKFVSMEIKERRYISSAFSVQTAFFS